MITSWQTNSFFPQATHTHTHTPIIHIYTHIYIYITQLTSVQLTFQLYIIFLTLLPVLYFKKKFLSFFLFPPLFISLLLFFFYFFIYSLWLLPHSTMTIKVILFYRLFWETFCSNLTDEGYRSTVTKCPEAPAADITVSFLSLITEPEKGLIEIHQQGERDKPVN